MGRKLHYSTSDSTEQDFRQGFSYGLEEVSLEPKTILERAGKGFHIIPPVLQDYNKIHKGENFKYVDLIAVDIDGGLSLSEARRNFSKSAFGYYTTRSHQKQKGANPAMDRFRILFALPDSCYHPGLYGLILDAFVQLYGADNGASKITQGYLGCVDAEVGIFDSDNVLDVEALLCDFKAALSDKKWGTILKKRAKLCMIAVDELGEGFWDHLYKRYFIGFARKSTSSKPSSAPAKERPIPKVRNPDFVLLQSKCRLIHNVNDCNHQSLFHLAANFSAMRNGKTMFLELTKNRPYNHGRRGKGYYAKLANSIASNRYSPSNCQRHCEYFEDCATKPHNLVELSDLPRGEVQRIGNPPAQGRTVDDLRRELSVLCARVAEGPRNRVTLIEAPVGAGKTTALKNTKWPSGTIAATPKIDLANELSIGKVFPPFPDQLFSRDDLRRLLSWGNSEQAMVELKRNVKRDPSLIDVKAKIAQYQLGVRDGVRAARSTATTQRVFQNSDLLKGKKLLICDEDPLNHAGRSGRISRAYLDHFVNHPKYANEFFERGRKALERGQKSHRKEQEKFLALQQIRYKLSELLELPEGLHDNPIPSKCALEAEACLRYVTTRHHIALQTLILCASLARRRGAPPKTYNLKNMGKDFDLANLALADSLLINDESIEWYRNPVFPDTDLLVVADNIDVAAYESLFGRENVTHHNLGEIDAAGEVYQFTEHSFSATSLERDQERLKEFKSIVQSFKEQGFNVITHKDYSASEAMCLGGAIGSNIFEGQDLLVIGTKSPPPNFFLLRERALGLYDGPYSTYSDAHYQTVEDRHYKYRMMPLTDNEETNRRMSDWTRNITKQAMGRARHALHPCIVVIVSNIPLPGVIQLGKIPKDIKNLPQQIRNRKFAKA